MSHLGRFSYQRISRFSKRNRVFIINAFPHIKIIIVSINIYREGKFSIEHRENIIFPQSLRRLQQITITIFPSHSLPTQIQQAQVPKAKAQLNKKKIKILFRLSSQTSFRVFLSVSRFSLRFLFPKRLWGEREERKKLFFHYFLIKLHFGLLTWFTFYALYIHLKFKHDREF